MFHIPGMGGAKCMEGEESGHAKVRLSYAGMWRMRMDNMQELKWPQPHAASSLSIHSTVQLLHASIFHDFELMQMSVIWHQIKTP